MKQEHINEIKKQRNILKAIGVLEIIGGTAGVGIIMWFLLQGYQMNSYTFLIYLVAIVFYGYSIYAGVNLFKKNEDAISHSWIIQFIQIVSFSLNGVTFLLTSGGNLLIGYNFTEKTINISFGIIASEFNIIANSIENDFIKINILAILIIYFLDKSFKSIKEKQQILNNYIEKIGSHKYNKE
ncbi:hypothetical protein BTO06_17440 [Tenacibaculum sp. SZ-18]|uniref:hypothetical protein n=1 Tax=Tenacibaculum sp. SZ-18 TaxID=754423 RepID=UPI000C2D4491|nr:hypothetical protein [Tenacibaculum sp. SZ-18]AUC16817.1 hypothetical protein BTO06_17440 [Tenacibaculum sp. SZ-18]